MSGTDAMFLCAGVLMNGLTFALGIAVGITLRKDSEHDDSDSKQAEASTINRWHLPLDIGAPYSPQLRGRGGASAKPETDPAKRAAR